MENENNYNVEQPKGSGSGKFWIVGGALALALGANAYLMVRSNHLNEEIAAVKDTSAVQFSKLDQASQTASEENRQLLDKLEQSVREAHNNAANAQVAVKRAQAETKKQDDHIIQRLEQQKSELAGELSQLKDATADTNSKLGQVSNDVGGVKTDVEGVKTEVASAKSQIEQQTADLKRALGDMGVMSGLIATNSKDLEALRALGERNYYEFSLAKGQKSARVGNVMIALKKADVKKNRYTLEVLADDKMVEKRDRTINEPVQIYVGGARQPDEIVVNTVKKDVITGYLATPKVAVARR
jgi:chromosome segregation ATPase